ncbi:MFS transporter [Nocardioides sp.]|uniref:MFS transporter n=1 Tax=Nocardioides sp. TaxID=35761 RepID=UPI000C90D09E|nr:MFS transporter [Nocardioides sp.]MAS54992.1 MFS transporter [Pimelobacter sp.]MDE0776642.1 MFS transporter [Nocardioides sp.]
MSTPSAAVLDRRSRALLVFGAVAVAFAAIDTYVVVLALPEMMTSVGISAQDLQRAAPIISGFLLGYVAVLPLIGRVADLRGPVPVLVASLVTFTVGSVVTAVGYDLAGVVAGRFLQGLGGGGLVPATMALVAALYPVELRGMPLGLVSAVQEFGSVLGPLFGAAVLSVSSWRAIFAINAAVAVLLVVVVRVLRHDDDVRAAPRGPSHRPATSVEPRRGLPDLLGAAALLVATVCAVLVLYPPDRWYLDLTYGELFIPVVASGRWLSPLGLVAVAGLLILVVRCFTARRPLVDARSWGRSLVAADLAGATYLAVALGGVVLAFATADPEISVFSPQGPWLLAASALAVVALVIHLRRSSNPLVPPGTLRAMPAWGSLVVSLLVGWALIAALVDIPLFARTTTYDTQLGAALVLLRFLVALPVGAVAGGYLVRGVPAGAITCAGMLLSAGSFWWMSTWGETSLDSFASNVPLVLCGLGFGLALAPVNAAILATTRDDTHGIASALVVVARMIGMLVGISVLTTWGLARLYDAGAANPDLSVTELGILQEQAVFEGAALFALMAAVAGVILLRGAPTRRVDTGAVTRPEG